MADIKKLKFTTQKDERDTTQQVRQQQAAAEDASITRLFDDVVSQALAGGATEIHVEALPDRTRIRTRIMNQLVEQGNVDRRSHPNLINRIKVLSGMDITKRGIAQKGYFQVNLGDRQIDLVAIIAPTPLGEKAFIKIHYMQALGLTLDQLGMYPNVLNQYTGVLERSNGLVLVAGPPGSGRTTTCYASLQHLASPEKNVCTFEANIRFQVPGVIQGKPEDRFDYTYIDGVRATLDQEPDLIYIGEMNDDQVARMTVGASFGKRIVLGRINASNGATALLSLLDMGLPGFLVAQGVIGVLSQRLVRRLCEGCREPYEPSTAVLRELNIKPKPGMTFYHATGCEQCGQTGFLGYLGIFELFIPNEAVQEMVIARAPARDINQAATETGLIPLRLDGFKKVTQGLTTVEEVLARL